MTEVLQKYLSYIHASLADAARLSPDLRSDDVVETQGELLLSGSIGEHATKTLFRKVKSRSKGTADDRLWPIPVLICPRVFSLRTEHGRADTRRPARVAPVIISAKICQNGEIVVDDKVEFPVLVPRNLLEPTSSEVVIGTVDDADSAYSRLAPAKTNWKSLLEQADQLLNELTGSTLDELEIDAYEPLDIAVFMPRGAGSATFFIEALVDSLRGADAPELPLLEKLVQAATDRDLLDTRAQWSASRLHIGQMEHRYGLADSQREALAHHLSNQSAPILAVDGPPGTGKTTLLLSAIASAWVSAALADAEPPIIVATSTNNQAVLNILRAFAEVDDEGTSPFAGRWLSGLDSYGMYLPARSKEAKENFPVHAMKGMGKDAIYEAQAYETEEGFASALEVFLEHAQKAFPGEASLSLDRVLVLLKAELAACNTQIQNTLQAMELLADAIQGQALCGEVILSTLTAADAELNNRQIESVAAEKRIGDLKALRVQWMAHCASEPWWMSLLASFRLQSPRLGRDAAFWAEREISHGELVGSRFREQRQRPETDVVLLSLLAAEEVGLEGAKYEVQGAKAARDNLMRAVAALRKLVPELGELTVETIQTALDKGARYDAFKLATHYWETRYLLEVEGQLRGSTGMGDSKAPDKLLRQYRRLAKLFPCFVTTLYSLPNRFTGYSGEPKPLYDGIDLLIVDEAGQVPLEIGMASFALAKRALVVGDVDQIKPIWAIPQPIDVANAWRHGVIPSMSESTYFHRCGLDVSASSLMRLAQRATPYSKHPARGRGMFLQEHRRCWSEIITICNRLAYGGLLQPCREEGPRRITPSVGYVHIPGVASRSGTSLFNRTEAAAIAKWLGQRKTQIEDAYQESGKSFGELVAVITPFAAQARTVRRALESELGKDHGITVGTVHALQGAERRIVVFSPTYGLDTVPGEAFFDLDPSILNVAISRAQDAFLVFGNMHLFQPIGEHPSAIVGKSLFNGGGNEISDVPVELLVPGFDMAPAALIRDLDAHRSVLAEAFEAARNRLVIVSPFLSSAAIGADRVLEKVSKAVGRGVSVTVVSDPMLNQRAKAEYAQCIERLKAAGAKVRVAQSQGVHSKLVLVDYAWLVIGSFNWLSAVRNDKSDFFRYESSLRYDGSEAFEMIGRTLRDLKEIVNSPASIERI